MPSINSPTITTNGIVRPTQVEVNLARISENYKAIKEHVAPARLMPILKANAYGHGLVEIARHLVQLGAPIISELQYWKKGSCFGNKGWTVRFWCWGGSWATKFRIS